MSDSPQIQAIKQRYRESLKEKADMVAKFRSSIEVESQFDLMKEELHKLAGSSGMYGYQDLADTCRAAMGSIDSDAVGVLADQLDLIVGLLNQYSE